MSNSPQSVLRSHQRQKNTAATAMQRLYPRPYVASTGGNEAYYFVKRVTDIILACLLLVMSAPLMLLIAVLIPIDTVGPVLFRQTRIGSRRVHRNGRTVWEPYQFTMFKFRTMEDGAAADIHRQFMQAFIHNDEVAMNSIKAELGDAVPQAEQNGSNGKSNGTPYKIHADPRITRVGKVLRKTSLDELPQLINVIRGEMSLVGPRPPLPYEMKEYKTWHMRRFAAYQGITGYWQIAGRSTVSFDNMVEQDIWYTEHQSLLLDFKIMLLTPLKMVKGKGAG